MQSFLISALITMMCPLASAGPGAGGGTDVDSKTHTLLDFKTAYREVEIDPRLYKGTQGAAESIYQRIAPKIQRLEYFFPGLSEALEKALDKQWIMTNEAFPPNQAGEKKPIKQTDRFVKITYTEFKKLSAEGQAQAWLHELVRGYVMAFDLSATNPSVQEMPVAETEDKIVRSITPLIYSRFARLTPLNRGDPCLQRRSQLA